MAWRNPCATKSLKAPACNADAEGMFIPSDQPLVVTEASLEAFCAALNTPVVDIDDLDTSPARAAIVMCAGECGDSSLAVMVRSVTSGETVCFRFQGDPREFGSPTSAISAALGFAEGMGFLFEDDIIESGGNAGRKRARKIWNSLLAPAEAGDVDPSDVSEADDEEGVASESASSIELLDPADEYAEDESEQESFEAAAEEFLQDDPLMSEELELTDALSAPDLTVIELEPVPEPVIETLSPIEVSYGDSIELEAEMPPEVDTSALVGEANAPGLAAASESPSAIVTGRTLTKFRRGLGDVEPSSVPLVDASDSRTQILEVEPKTARVSDTPVVKKMTMKSQSVAAEGEHWRGFLTRILSSF